MHNQPGSQTNVKIQIIENPTIDMQFHPELEIAYVLDGEIELTLKDREYHLDRGQMVLIDSGLPFTASGIDSIISLFQISPHVLADVMKDPLYSFVCNSAADSSRPYSVLREILDRLIYNDLENRHETSCMTYSLEYELFDCLIEEFQGFRLKEQTDAFKKSDERLQMMLNYVNTHYQNQVSLDDLAQSMYLSKSSLSRFFRKETGLYFSEYITDVRLHYALNDLIYTDESITRIAVNNGFSNPSVFSRSFQEKYRISPSAYRKQTEKLKKTEVTKSVKEKIQHQLHYIAEKKTDERKILKNEIFCDVDKTGLSENFWSGINIGSAFRLTLANMQNHTLYLCEKLQFKQVRIWNIFSKKMNIREDHRFNFDTVDTVLDFLVENKLTPVLDFGFRPEGSVKTGDQMVFFEEDNLQFNTIGEWRKITRELVRHLIKRYDLSEVSTWTFEYSLGTTYSYYDTENGRFTLLEKYTNWYEIVRSQLPEVRIMGPSISIMENSDVFEEFLSGCRKNHCLPDMISIMLFPYQSVEVDNGSKYALRISDLSYLDRQISRVRQLMERHGAKNMKLCITEWNPTVSARNYLNDSCFRAAYFLKIITMLRGKVDFAFFWMGTDWISSYYDSAQIIRGGVGLITKDKIRKPAFYAVDFLNRLGSQFIQSGENYVITSNGKSSYYIACFNFKWYASNYYMKDEDDLDIENLGSIFENEDSMRLFFRLNHIETDTKFIVKKRMINEEYGSILREWMRFNCEEELEGSDVTYLRDICIPHLSMKKIVSTGDTLAFDTVLEPQEIALIHIYPEY